ncbi:MAG: hypothetical protein IIX64_05570 [Bacteroidales bacterium]|nr:hypothetical protein [Bacteroidales bacterium]
MKGPQAMKSVFQYILLCCALCVSLSLSAMGRHEEVKKEHASFLEQLQERDSLLLADQLRYGVRIYRLEENTRLTPSWEDNIMLSDSLMVVRDWHIDTISAYEAAPGDVRSDIELSVQLTSFDAARYHLPGIVVERWFKDGVVDSLVFAGEDIEYFTIPVDTATFQVHPLKAQIEYPVTFVEILPYLGGAILLVLLVVLAVFLIRRYLSRRDEAVLKREPAHIVALRKLDAYRGDKYWTEDKQKQFYSGVTDALREYISARYGVSALEMTTRELFVALKDAEMDLTLKTALQKLFETADFVKFAKMTLPREENASVVPFAVQFVTATYEQQLQEENAREENKN